jgi:seryl-tRNA synthetase
MGVKMDDIQQQQEQEKTFTQSELNRIIEDRLARQAKQYADHDELRGVVDELNEYGYVGTPSEVKAQIKQQREAYQKQSELEQLQYEAQTQGTSPEMMAEIRELKNELSEIKAERQAKKAEIETAHKQNQEWQQQVSVFQQKHGDVDLEKLGENPKFIKFIKGKGLPLVELYDDFVEFVGEAEAEAISKMKSKDIRSTGNGKGGNSEGGVTYGLTERQQNLAKENGITMKEYSEAMKMIKK